MANCHLNFCRSFSVMRRALFWLPVALGVIFMLLLAYHRRDVALHAKNDFVTFYAGAKLAGTPDLYSRTANLELNTSLVGNDMNVMYIRPPFYAAILKPLSWLPFLTAYAVFTCLSLACYIWFVVRFSKECSALPFLAAISIPFLASLLAGQDASFMMAILGGSILLTRQKKDFLAGLVLSLCAYKFHIFLFIPLLLLLKKRWLTLGGGLCGTLALTALGIIVNGPGSIPQWIHVLRNPWINPDARGMPNIHGLVTILNGDMRLEAVLIATVFLGFLWMTLRNDNYELLFAACLICGLLVSYHSMIDDDLILFPVMILVLRSSELVPLRASTALILTPIPYFLVLAGPPYSAIMPVALGVMLAGMFWSAGTPSPLGLGRQMVGDVV
jgi:hypothetical protein